MAKLSYIKIGKKEFFLVPGDKFSTNGSTFTYHPSTRENQSKCGRYDDHWRSSTTIQVTKKYKEAILAEKFDNLKEISRRKPSEDSKWEIIEWEITDVEEVRINKPNHGELWYIGIGIREFGREKKDLFNISAVKIKERTKKQIVLEKDLIYVKKWNTEEWLDKLISKQRWGSDRLSFSDDYGVFIEMPSEEDPERAMERLEKMEEWKDKLKQALQNKLEGELKRAEDNLAKFKEQAKNSGY